ncbi:MarR family winged helix-turn-helix transcriptional regulator [Sphingobium boeckii]|uniref:DNA-binding MarR family transcriptional regulator n=1 Tax=Sphingobium boeckii TaxID=1082345 RepID=A0A7W9EE84_9SPHN|nr:MarR family transcriptional regulator [Sphingobium boeckii]MBB5685998.1 DNA-binding MarR family transcriptional regulator [Sphingobium boeckii]
MSEDLRPLGDPGSDAFRVDAYPFYLLNRAVGRYNVVIETELRAIGIDIPTWRVLMILGEQCPLPIAQVARLAVINISTMVRIVERMAKAGLITTAPSQQDGRATDLHLTDKGTQTLTAARAKTAPLYRKLIRGISAEDFSKLLSLLDLLHDNLE